MSTWCLTSSVRVCCWLEERQGREVSELSYQSLISYLNVKEAYRHVHPFKSNWMIPVCFYGKEKDFGDKYITEMGLFEE